MDLYISSMVLGAIGFTAMALGGLGSRGGGHHGAGAHGHAGTTGHVHGGTTGHVHGAAHGHSHVGAVRSGHAHTSGVAGRTFWLITSPRFLFSLMLGFGATGAMLHPVLPGPALLAAAAVGAVAFERFLVTPLWNFAMRFASRPASTFESAVADEAVAVSTFDDNGQGIVSLELDGQVLQVLATLQPQDRLLGARVHAGQRLRIDDVNAAKQSCTVSIL
jgi:hypothetical protein